VIGDYNVELTLLLEGQVITQWVWSLKQCWLEE